MLDAPGDPLQQGQSVREGVRRATGQSDQPSLARGRHRSEHRHVHDPGLPVRGLGQRQRGPRRHRAEVEEGAAAVAGVKESLRTAIDVQDRAIVEQRREDEVVVLREEARTGRRRDAVLAEPGRVDGRPVPAGDLAALLPQALGQRATHPAQTRYADPHVHPPLWAV